MPQLVGSLLLDGALVQGSVSFEGGLITEVVTDPGAALEGLVLCPGMIDIHVHGYGGYDPLVDLEGMARALARAGTTSFLPTLFPRAPKELGQEAESVHRASAKLPPGVARSLGTHLEGPYVNPKSAGALPVADLADPSVPGLRQLIGPATSDGRGIRTLTVAPELPGAQQLIAELDRCGIRVSLGHSQSEAREARDAIQAGARGITHLYNAMSGVHHRHPGLASVALTEDAVCVELIGDLVHVDERAVELALRARGPGRVCLVSDALKGAGTGCDTFEWHGRKHQIRQGAAYYPDRVELGVERPAQLAGSAMGQLEQVRTLVDRGIVSIEEALTMATSAPALALDIQDEFGHIEIGRRADLVCLDRRSVTIEAVFVQGVRVQ